MPPVDIPHPATLLEADERDVDRAARFYAITKAGEKQLAAEAENWERVAAMMGRVLADRGAES